ncbi:hypothetical protein OSTOST_05460 [Ostertagia ostertagi]
MAELVLNGGPVTLDSITTAEFVLTREPLSSNSLVDFDKPEGLLPQDEGSESNFMGVRKYSKSGPQSRCWYQPLFNALVLLQVFGRLPNKIASLIRYMASAQKSIRSINTRQFQIIHITFCALAVLQWMPSVHVVAIEINQSFVQIHEWYNMSSYLIYIILLSAASFGAIVLPSITLSIAATQLIPYSQQLKSDVTGICLALATALLAATMCCFSGYATSRSLTNVTQWYEQD